MEGELRCEGEERTAAVCPATALPTEPPNRHTLLPVAAVINNDGGERKRRTRGERGKPLCCCCRVGGLAVGGAAATSSPLPSGSLPEEESLHKGLLEWLAAGSATAPLAAGKSH
ncbi:uncharacterized protein DS421_15g519210 [Arachis hypogaea]|uniref:Uncharacterized protein n=1 Tax=Arachis hypogaea TaxID=3818 RepID=A0A444YYT0_ARAHY|nr:uncharacterized protein DS421_15g519210 [Arachis hypogaea]RYR07078.1 hypothetical protein Ahy_B05g074393 [Arachis hypogaea]